MRRAWLVGIALVQAGCGGLPEHGERLDPQAACVVEGETDTGRIDVSADGVEGFSVALNERARVRLILSSGPPAIEVRGPHLEFAGQATSFPLHLAAPATAMGDLVRWRSGTDVAAVEVEDGALVAAFGSGLEPRLSGVRLPCASLAPGQAPVHEAAVDGDGEDPTLPTSGMATRLPLAIHLQPDDARAVVLTAEEPELVSLELGEAQNGWRVVQWHGEGVSVRGWAKDADVRETQMLLGGGMGFTTGCCIGRSAVGRIETWTLSAGTAIFASAGQGAWARVHTPVAVEVERVPGARYGRVVEIPDLATGCWQDNVWVDLGP